MTRGGGDGKQNQRRRRENDGHKRSPRRCRSMRAPGHDNTVFKVRNQLREGCGATAPVQKGRVRCADGAPGAELGGAPLVNIDQPVLVLKGQRFELNGIDKAEYRGVRADTQRERRNDDDCGHRASKRRPDGIAKIVHGQQDGHKGCDVNARVGTGLVPPKPWRRRRLGTRGWACPADLSSGALAEEEALAKAEVGG